MKPDGYWPSIAASARPLGLGFADPLVIHDAELMARAEAGVQQREKPGGCAHPETGHRYILTATGKQFDFDNISPEVIDIKDIAAALSKICRFTGHCSEFYSVAQHSVIVSYLVRNDALVAPAPGLLQHVELQGLLHDAPEAYISDVSSPLKDVIGPLYRPLEEKVWGAIADAFALPLNLHPAVKRADLIALGMEYRDLMPPDQTPWKILEGLELPREVIIPWGPRYARERFIERFNDLEGTRYL